MKNNAKSSSFLVYTDVIKNKVWVVFELILKHIHYYDINQQDKDGNTMLHILVETNEVNYFEKLLEKKPDVNLKNKNGDTPLHIACSDGNVQIVEMLLQDKNCAINTENVRGKTPICAAVESGHLDVVKELMERGANMFSKHTTILHLACEIGASPLIQYILDKSEVNVNSKNNCGYTPLQVAVSKGHLKAVEILIRNGGDVNVLDNKKRGLLHIAVANRHVDMAKCLVENGCNINLQDHEGLTCLHLIAESGFVEFVSFFCGVHTDFSIPDQDGCLALHTFVRNECFNYVLQDILKMSDDINAVNNNGDTPLHSAVMCNNKVAIDSLINKGADVNIANKIGKTALDTSSSALRFMPS